MKQRCAFVLLFVVSTLSAGQNSVNNNPAQDPIDTSAQKSAAASTLTPVNTSVQNVGDVTALKTTGHAAQKSPDGAKHGSHDASSSGDHKKSDVAKPPVAQNAPAATVPVQKDMKNSAVQKSAPAGAAQTQPGTVASPAVDPAQKIHDEFIHTQVEELVKNHKWPELAALPRTASGIPDYANRVKAVTDQRLKTEIDELLKASKWSELGALARGVSAIPEYAALVDSAVESKLKSDIIALVKKKDMSKQQIADAIQALGAPVVQFIPTAWDLTLWNAVFDEVAESAVKDNSWADLYELFSKMSDGELATAVVRMVKKIPGEQNKTLKAFIEGLVQKNRWDVLTRVIAQTTNEQNREISTMKLSNGDPLVCAAVRAHNIPTPYPPVYDSAKKVWLVVGRTSTVDLVHILLANGADVQSTDQKGEPLLITAVKNVQKGRRESWRYDVQKNQAIHDDQSDTSCKYTCGNITIPPAPLDIVTLLLDKGAPVNGVDSVHGNTALHNALTYGPTELVLLLLSKGADTGLFNKAGYSPLMTSIQRGEPAVFDAVVQKAKINMANAEGITPLMVAAQEGRFVKELLDKGAKVDAKDKKGKTALDYARDNKRADAERILVEWERDHGKK